MEIIEKERKKVTVLRSIKLLLSLVAFIFVTQMFFIGSIKVSAAGEGYWTDEGIRAKGFESGTGTEEDPYIIKTAAQMGYMAYCVNCNADDLHGKYFKLGADIDFSDHTWILMGRVAEEVCFQGHFDGDGHKISNLTRPLFGGVYDAEIHDLTIVDSSFGYDYETGHGYYASVACVVNKTEIYNVISYSKFKDIDGMEYGIGGIVGIINDETSIHDCAYYGEIIMSRDVPAAGITSEVNSKATKVSIYNNCVDAVISLVSNHTTVDKGAITNYSFFSLEDIVIKNNYYNAEKNPTRLEINGTPFKNEDIKSGKVTYELNDHGTRNVWQQDLSATESKPGFAGGIVDCKSGKYVNVTAIHECSKSLKYVSAVSSTDTKNGTNAHYVCNECGKYFEDSSAKKEVNKYWTIDYKKVWDGTAAEGFAYGSGSLEDPYLVRNAFELAALNNMNFIEGSYFKQTSDIDLLNLSWTPIGDNAKGYFYGNYDGDNHTISNIKGMLFSDTEYSEIKNVDILSGTFFATSNNDNVGSVVGKGYKVINCTSKSSYEENPNFSIKYLGGIVGCTDEMNAYVSDCSYEGNIVTQKANYVGGIYGANIYKGFISGCNFTGRIDASGNCSYVGGLSGYGNYYLVEKNTINCDISVTTDNAAYVEGLSYIVAENYSYYPEKTVRNNSVIGSITANGVYSAAAVYIGKGYTASFNLFAIEMDVTLKNNGNAAACAVMGDNQKFENNYCDFSKNHIYRYGDETEEHDMLFINNISDSNQDIEISHGENALNSQEFESGKAAYLLNDAGSHLWGQNVKESDEDNDFDEYPYIGGPLIDFADNGEKNHNVDSEEEIHKCSEQLSIVEGTPATESETGLANAFVCDICGRKYLDSAATVVYSKKTAIVYHMSTWDGKTVDAGFSKGKGTSENPFVISSPTAFVYLANNYEAYNNMYFALDEDLNFNNKEVKTISEFTCNFDGRGHSINSIYCDSHSGRFGVFNTLKNSTIKNLVVNVYIKGFDDSCGSVAGSAYDSNFINCINVHQIYCGAWDNISGAGGIVGYAKDSQFIGCQNYASLSTFSNIEGAITAKSENCTFDNCINLYSPGNRYSKPDDLISGRESNSNYINCYSRGNETFAGSDIARYTDGSQVASGELAYNINMTSDNKCRWGQIIEGDNIQERPVYISSIDEVPSKTMLVDYVEYGQGFGNVTELHTCKECFEKHEYKEATATEEGNLEYYRCTKCGKYYLDTSAKNEVELVDTILAPLTWDGTVATEFYSGSGSKDDPFVIVNGSQFAYMMEYIKEKYESGVYGNPFCFAIKTDIYLSGHDITPVGDSSLKVDIYGNNHKIHGLSINSSEGNAALFSDIYSLRVYDLTIASDCFVTSTNGSAATFLVSRYSPYDGEVLFENCNNYAKVTAYNNACGYSLINAGYYKCSDLTILNTTSENGSAYAFGKEAYVCDSFYMDRTAEDVYVEREINIKNGNDNNYRIIKGIQDTIKEGKVTSVSLKDSKNGALAYLLASNMTVDENGRTWGQKLKISEDDTAYDEYPVYGHDYVDFDDYGNGYINVSKMHICSNNLEKVDAVDATDEKDGNIEYYICKKCGRCYTDDKAETEISKEEVNITNNSYGDGSAVSETLEGEGTKDAPYLIKSGADLRFIDAHLDDEAYNASGVYYMQTADIDLNNKKFSPIGSKKSDVNYGFKATYDGNDKEIKNLYGYLFYYAYYATIKNVHITSGTMLYSSYKDRSDTVEIGSIAGYISNSTISNCSSMMKFDSRYFAYTTDKKYYYTPSSIKIGGLVGYSVSSNIEHSFYINEDGVNRVKNSSNSIGALLGEGNNSGISSSYANMTVDGKYDNVRLDSANENSKYNTCAIETTGTDHLSGGFAYIINGNTSEGELSYGQEIGKDIYPVKGGMTVYECDGYYTNTDPVNLPVYASSSELGNYAAAKGWNDEQLENAAFAATVEPGSVRVAEDKEIHRTLPDCPEFKIRYNAGNSEIKSNIYIHQNRYITLDYYETDGDIYIVYLRYEGGAYKYLKIPVTKSIAISDKYGNGYKIDDCYLSGKLNDSNCHLWLEKEDSKDGKLYAKFAKETQKFYEFSVYGLTMPAHGRTLDKYATTSSAAIKENPFNLTWTLNGNKVAGRAEHGYKYTVYFELHLNNGYYYYNWRYKDRVECDTGYGMQYIYLTDDTMRFSLTSPYVDDGVSISPYVLLTKEMITRGGTNVLNSDETLTVPENMIYGVKESTSDAYYTPYLDGSSVIKASLTRDKDGLYVSGTEGSTVYVVAMNRSTIYTKEFNKDGFVSYNDLGSDIKTWDMDHSLFLIKYKDASGNTYFKEATIEDNITNIEFKLNKVATGEEFDTNPVYSSDKYSVNVRYELGGKEVTGVADSGCEYDVVATITPNEGYSIKYDNLTVSAKEVGTNGNWTEKSRKTLDDGSLQITYKFYIKSGKAHFENGYEFNQELYKYDNGVTLEELKKHMPKKAFLVDEYENTKVLDFVYEGDSLESIFDENSKNESYIVINGYVIVPENYENAGAKLAIRRTFYVLEAPTCKEAKSSVKSTDGYYNVDKYTENISIKLSTFEPDAEIYYIIGDYSIKDMDPDPTKVGGDYPTKLYTPGEEIVISDDIRGVAKTTWIRVLTHKKGYKDSAVNYYFYTIMRDRNTFKEPAGIYDDSLVFENGTPLSEIQNAVEEKLVPTFQAVMKYDDEPSQGIIKLTWNRENEKKYDPASPDSQTIKYTATAEVADGVNKSTGLGNFVVIVRILKSGVKPVSEECSSVIGNPTEEEYGFITSNDNHYEKLDGSENISAEAVVMDDKVIVTKLSEEDKSHNLMTVIVGNDGKNNWYYAAPVNERPSITASHIAEVMSAAGNTLFNDIDLSSCKVWIQYAADSEDITTAPAYVKQAREYDEELDKDISVDAHHVVINLGEGMKVVSGDLIQDGYTFDKVVIETDKKHYFASSYQCVDESGNLSVSRKSLSQIEITGELKGDVTLNLTNASAKHDYSYDLSIDYVNETVLNYGELFEFDSKTVNEHSGRLYYITGQFSSTCRYKFSGQLSELKEGEEYCFSYDKDYASDYAYHNNDYVIVPKKDRKAPEGIKNTTVYENGKAKGVFSNIPDGCQYKYSGSEWIDITGSILEVCNAGSYTFRYKGSNELKLRPSLEVTYTITFIGYPDAASYTDKEQETLDEGVIFKSAVPNAEGETFGVGESYDLTNTYNRYAGEEEIISNVLALPSQILISNEEVEENLYLVVVGKSSTDGNWYYRVPVSDEMGPVTYADIKEKLSLSSSIVSRKTKVWIEKEVDGKLIAKYPTYGSGYDIESAEITKYEIPAGTAEGDITPTPEVEVTLIDSEGNDAGKYILEASWNMEEIKEPYRAYDGHKLDANISGDIICATGITNSKNIKASLNVTFAADDSNILKKIMVKDLASPSIVDGNIVPIKSTSATFEFVYADGHTSTETNVNEKWEKKLEDGTWSKADYYDGGIEYRYSTNIGRFNSLEFADDFEIVYENEDCNSAIANLSYDDRYNKFTINLSVTYNKTAEPSTKTDISRMYLNCYEECIYLGKSSDYFEEAYIGVVGEDGTVSKYVLVDNLNYGLDFRISEYIGKTVRVKARKDGCAISDEKEITIPNRPTLEKCFTIKQPKYEDEKGTVYSVNKIWYVAKAPVGREPEYGDFTQYNTGNGEYSVALAPGDYYIYCAGTSDILASEKFKITIVKGVSRTVEFEYELNDNAKEIVINAQPYLNNIGQQDIRIVNTGNVEGSILSAVIEAPAEIKGVFRLENKHYNSSNNIEAGESKEYLLKCKSEVEIAGDENGAVRTFNLKVKVSYKTYEGEIAYVYVPVKLVISPKQVNVNYYNSTSDSTPIYTETVIQYSNVTLKSAEDAGVTINDGYKFYNWKLESGNIAKPGAVIKVNAENRNNNLLTYNIYAVVEKADGIVGTGKDTNNISYELTDTDGDRRADKLVISGAGAMMDYDASKDAPWYGSRDSVTMVEIGSGITYVGTDTFVGFKKVSTIVINGENVVFDDNLFDDVNAYIFYKGYDSSKENKWMHDGLTVVAASYDDETKTIYLDNDLIIEEGKTFDIAEGYTLVVPKGKTLTINGTVKNEGTLQVEGTLVINKTGKLTGLGDTVINGTLTVNGGTIANSECITYGENAKTSVTVLNDNCTVSLVGKNTYTYNGKVVKPTVKVTTTIGGKTIDVDKNIYTVYFKKYITSANIYQTINAEDIKNAGTYKVYVKAIDGSKELSGPIFAIEKAEKPVYGADTKLNVPCTYSTVSELSNMLPENWGFISSDSTKTVVDYNALNKTYDTKTITVTAEYVGDDKSNYESTTVKVEITTSHKYDSEHIEFSDGVNTCDATWLCENETDGNRKHTISESVTVASKTIDRTVKNEATCETDRVYSCVAKFKNPAFGTHKYDVTEEGSALGHDFEVQEYVWEKNKNGDYECTATKICKRDKSHVVTETVKAGVDLSESTATCDKPGVAKYIAEFEDEAFTKQNKEENVEYLNHSYKTIVTPAKDCKTDGESYDQCEYCGDIINKKAVKGAHNLKLIPKKDSTESEEGYEAYYKCQVCGKLFSDAKATKEITKPVVIAKKSNNLPAINAKITDAKSKAIYKVTTSPASNVHEVTYVRPANKKTVKKVTIPSTITISGVKYKVTGIAPKAFNGCKKLKTILIKTKLLSKKTVAKKAFKGLKKGTIKVPKKNLKAYKKLFKSKGLSKKVKVKG